MRFARLVAGFVTWLALFATALAGEDALYGGGSKEKLVNNLPEWKWRKDEKKKIDELAAKAVKDAEGYQTIETDNWIVKTQASARYTAEAALYMDIFYDAFQQVFYFKTGIGLAQKPIFFVHANRATYLAKSGAPEWTGGVFRFGFRAKSDGSKDYMLQLHTYVYGATADPAFASKETPLPTIQHEGTHCLLARMLGDRVASFPVWLNEGMATYYEYWDLRYKASDSGDQQRDMSERKQRLERSPTPEQLAAYFKRTGGKPPELRYLLSLKTQKEWSVGLTDETIRLHYALAESFADFMICAKARREFLKTMFTRLEAGEPLIKEEEVPKLEKDWLFCLRTRWDIELKKKKASK